MKNREEEKEIQFNEQKKKDALYEIVMAYKKGSITIYTLDLFIAGL